MCALREFEGVNCGSKEGQSFSVFHVMVMKVREIMHHAEYAPSHISVADAARLMDRKRLDSMLVEHAGVVGIFTERDILRKVVAKGLDPGRLRVSEIMSFPLQKIDSEHDAEEASNLMERHDIRRLVVMDRGGIVGVVSATCIARNIKYITARRLMQTQNVGSGIV
jgi:CBS domain-containing protein